MPIEVPDTRAFADPPPRRRRAAAPTPVEPAAVASSFAKPIRRRRPAAVLEAPVVEAPVLEAPVLDAPVLEAPVLEAPVLEAPAAAEPSAFSRPVRRRPRTEPLPVPSDIVEPAAVERAVEPAPEPVAAEPVAAEPVVVEEPAPADPVVVLTDTVVVRLAGTRYSVDMDAVAEVGRPPHVTRVPGVPAWIAGVANWRGRVLPVVDLRVLLGAAVLDLGMSGRILVLARDGVTLAFLAERVEGVVSLDLNALEPVLATLSRTTASILAGQLTHPEGPIAVLDLETIFALRSQLPRVRRAG